MVLLHKHNASVTHFPFLEKLACRLVCALLTLTQALSKISFLQCPCSRVFLLAGAWCSNLFLPPCKNCCFHCHGFSRCKASLKENIGWTGVSQYPLGPQAKGNGGGVEIRVAG